MPPLGLGSLLQRNLNVQADESSLGSAASTIPLAKMADRMRG